LTAVFFGVFVVVVGELAIVGVVVVSRVEVDVVRRFFGGATAWPLVVV
jgi:hypothetical protein